MISVIRNKIQKRAFRFILWGVVIVFVFPTFFSSLKLARRRSHHAVALVNGTEIGGIEYHRRVEEEKHRLNALQQQFGEFYEQFLALIGLSAEPTTNALELMIQEQLLNDAAQKTGIVVSDDYAQRCLHSAACGNRLLGSLVHPALYDNQGALIQKALITYVQRQGLTIDQFENMVENTLSRHLLVQLLQQATYVTVPALREQLLREHSLRQFDIIFFPLRSFLERAQKEVSDSKEAHKRAQEDLFNHMREASLQLNKGVDAVVAEFNGKKEKPVVLASSDTAAWEALQKKGLPVSRMKNMIHPQAETYSLGEEGGYLVVLQKIDQLEAQKDESADLARRLLAEYAQITASAFIANLRRSGTIEVYSTTLS